MQGHGGLVQRCVQVLRICLVRSLLHASIVLDRDDIFPQAP